MQFQNFTLRVNMIYLAVTVVYSCLFFPHGVLPHPTDFNAKVEAYFDKMNISDPTPNEWAIARDVIYERERADKCNQELGRLRGEKNALSISHVRFIPRALVDKVQERYQKEFTVKMESYRLKLADLVQSEKSNLSSVTNYQNKLKNTSLDEAACKALDAQISTCTDYLHELRRQISSLKRILPDPLWTKVNTRAHRILKREHVWSWIFTHKSNDEDVRGLWKSIQERYQNKTEAFKKSCSLRAYKQKFCHAMGEIHEDLNVVAHIVGRIPITRGHEFKIIRIFGNDQLDEFSTILINVVGLSQVLSPSKEDTYSDVPFYEIVKQKE